VPDFLKEFGAESVANSDRHSTWKVDAAMLIIETVWGDMEF
jgi:hypothetical protein